MSILKKNNIFLFKMADECKQFIDMSYAKKNKDLCVYCSYREAVPSKNFLFCSETCRLLHFSISEHLEIKDIAKLIKLSKIDLIQIILTLKSQNITKKQLYEMFDKKIKGQGEGLNVCSKDISINFD